MSNIGKRLLEIFTQRSGAGHWDILWEAADEIERLRAENEELRAKLIYSAEASER